MDVRLSPEQVALRDSARQLVGRLGPTTVADLGDAERRSKLDAAVTAAGWRDLRAAGDDGRPWASAVEVALVAEELASAAADSPVLGPTLAADLRRRAGAPAATGQETVALTSDLGALAAAGDGVAIDAAGATTALVLQPPASGVVARRDAPGDNARTVGLGVVGVAVAAVRTDLTRPLADTTGAAEPVDGSLTADDLVSWTALGLAVTSADLVGSMRAALDLATTYARERRQYGRPIGSFQAVQHLLADALVQVDGARSATLHAAWAVDALPPAEAVAAAAVAKAWSSRAARSVCETAIQVHGGIGNTWECFAHVHLRRALLSIDLFGGVGPSLDRVLAHQGIGVRDGLR